MCPMMQTKKQQQKKTALLYTQKRLKRKYISPIMQTKKLHFYMHKNLLKIHKRKTKKDSILRLKASKKSRLLVFYAFKASKINCLLTCFVC